MRLITLIKIGNEECFITTNYNESDAIDSFGCHIHHGLNSPGELRNGACLCSYFPLLSLALSSPSCYAKRSLQHEGSCYE